MSPMHRLSHEPDRGSGASDSSAARSIARPSWSSAWVVRWVSLLSPCILCMAVTCDEQDETIAIEDSRLFAESQRAFPPAVSDADRFGLVSPHGPSMGEEATADLSQIPLLWTTPAGWSEQSKTSMRLANFEVAGDPETECYLSILPGAAGGLEANVNRWREQMSLPPLSSAEVDQLPRKKLFGRDAAFVDLEGTFVGMSGTENKTGFRLAGLLIEREGVSMFLRMTGPAAVVAAELSHFEELAQSFRLPDSESPAADTSKQPSTTPLGLQAPPHWVEKPERPMREVTFAPNGGLKTEVYVSILGGDGGGLAGNINRWRGQMGQKLLSDAEIAELPSIEVMGRAGVYVEIKGDFTPMSGESGKDFMMLGVVRLLEGRCLFVKMTGPVDEVTNEIEHFRKFCQSLSLP